MKLEQQVVSLALAKRLKELGVKQESMFYWKNYRNPELDYWEIGEYDPGLPMSAVQYSAFNVAELEQIVPREVNVPYKNGKPREDHHWISMRRAPQGYRIAFQNSRYSSDSWFEKRGETFAEAFGLMLVYLIENGLMVGK